MPVWKRCERCSVRLKDEKGTPVPAARGDERELCRPCTYLVEEEERRPGWFE